MHSTSLKGARASLAASITTAARGVVLAIFKGCVVCDSMWALVALSLLSKLGRMTSSMRPWILSGKASAVEFGTVGEAVATIATIPCTNSRNSSVRPASWTPTSVATFSTPQSLAGRVLRSRLSWKADIDSGGVAFAVPGVALATRRSI